MYVVWCLVSVKMRTTLPSDYLSSLFRRLEGSTHEASAHAHPRAVPAQVRGWYATSDVTVEQRWRHD